MFNDYLTDNMAAARKYLAHFHLLIPVNELFMECIFLPSLRWKSCYLCVAAEREEYTAHCAYTRYTEHGIESFSQSFLTTEAAEKHPAKKGDVFCKIIRPERNVFQTLTKKCAEYHADNTSAGKKIVIDGVSAGIRFYDNGSIAKDIVIYPGDDSEAADDIINELINISEQI